MIPIWRGWLPAPRTLPMPLSRPVQTEVRAEGRHRRIPGDLPRVSRVRTVRSHRYPKARPR
ncbi:hypothetical protein HCB17_10650 [Salinispora arenicola]|uniref:hypothetical protein n=1 Tax=Salinispora arenicola TaxID=168697 RepID=UPI001430CCD2|nr:hypothetical protein [Salinispora arenicola]NIL41582.1 hypothetical protein [Salinispora arenicola]